MLCSVRELKLGEDHDGIIELPATPEVGTPAAKALGLEGPVIEFKLTPDRSDCFGVAGIARDLAAAGLGRLKPRDFEPVPASGPRPGDHARLPARRRSACPLFVGRIIRGVRNGPSPAWLQDRLTAIGLRPISALVDITNYLTFDLCRPLHVFDAAKLQRGPHLALRPARRGARGAGRPDLPAGRRHDRDRRRGRAGQPRRHHGRRKDGASPRSTTDVVLEVALFDPLRTAATGRRLGSRATPAPLRARVGSGLVLPATGVRHPADPRALRRAPGPAAWPARCRHPRRRSFPTRTAGAIGRHRARPAGDRGHSGRARLRPRRRPRGMAVQPPSWRHDVSTEACIVEELARLHGYDRIAPVPSPAGRAVGAGLLTPAQRRRSAVRRAVADLGYAEAVTWSFIPPEQAALFGAAEPVLKRNPLNAELSAMRPSLLPNLAGCGRAQSRAQAGNGALFEVGPRFTGAMPGEQVVALAGLRFGDAAPRHWAARQRPVDAIDAKGDALAGLAALGMKPESVQVVAEAPGWYHPARSRQPAPGPDRPCRPSASCTRACCARSTSPVPAVGFESTSMPCRYRRRVQARRGRCWSRCPIRRWTATSPSSSPIGRAGELVDAVRGVDRTPDPRGYGCSTSMPAPGIRAGHEVAGGRGPPPGPRPDADRGRGKMRPSRVAVGARMVAARPRREVPVQGAAASLA